MKRKVLWLVFGIMLCATLMACAKVGGISEKIEESMVDYGKGEVMELTFASNPSTGFDWFFELKDGDEYGNIVLERQENHFDSDMVGAGGFRSYFFRAVKAGKQELTFTYKRPWEGGEVDYDIVYYLDIEDDMTIHCINKKKGIVECDKEVSFFPDPVFQ